MVNYKMKIFSFNRFQNLIRFLRGGGGIRQFPLVLNQISLYALKKVFFFFFDNIASCQKAVTKLHYLSFYFFKLDLKNNSLFLPHSPPPAQLLDLNYEFFYIQINHAYLFEFFICLTNFVRPEIWGECILLQ